jgi:hypothetical protein
MTVAMNMLSLSAMGSSVAPNAEAWLKVRAMTPSRKSLTAAARNTTSAGPYSCCHSSHAVTGTRASRTRVMTFGMFSIGWSALAGIAA